MSESNLKESSVDVEHGAITTSINSNNNNNNTKSLDSPLYKTMNRSTWAVTATTADHRPIQVTDTRSPYSCWSRNHHNHQKDHSFFYPTHATLTIDGVTHEWNSRGHRKLRHPHPTTATNNNTHGPRHHCRHVRFLGYEPRCVTWYICIISFFANTSWVLNGVFETWPDTLSSEAAATRASFATGCIGAFLFIVASYLGVVEAINETYNALYVPRSTENDKGEDMTELEDGAVYKDFTRSELVKTEKVYGKFAHFLVGMHEHLDATKLLQEGYPIIEDDETHVVLTTPLFHRLTTNNNNNNNNNTSVRDALRNRKFNIRIGPHVMQVTFDHLMSPQEIAQQTIFSEDNNSKDAVSRADRRQGRRYIWWTWHPDIRHMGIFNAIVFFISTIIFFIPACSWYPMLQHHQASNASLIFWTQVTQIISCVGFIYVGHSAMAEASGSWWKPQLNGIGWWISLMNAIGAWGFMAYAILAIPSISHPHQSEGLLRWGAEFGTFWGSCAFWIAGILQCIEFGSRYPIDW